MAAAAMEVAVMVVEKAVAGLEEVMAEVARAVG